MSRWKLNKNLGGQRLCKEDLAVPDGANILSFVEAGFEERNHDGRSNKLHEETDTLDLSQD